MLKKSIELYPIEEINSTHTILVSRQSRMKPTRFIGKHFLDYFTYQAHRRKPKPREDVRCVQKIIYEKNLDIGARHVPLCVVSCFQKYHSERINF
mgnify:CR=1 FL=1